MPNNDEHCTLHHYDRVKRVHGVNHKSTTGEQRQAPETAIDDSLEAETDDSLEAATDAVPQAAEQMPDIEASSQADAMRDTQELIPECQPNPQAKSDYPRPAS